MPELKNSNGYTWFNGELIPSADANINVLSHALHYGYGVFEGTRAYRLDSGETAVFRLDDHIRRLGDSAKILDIEMTYDPETLRRASLDLIAAHPEFESCYLRHLVFLGAGAMGLFPRNNPTQTVISAWQWGAYLGEEGLERGIRTRISSFSRPFPNSTMMKAKATGNYVNSILAKKEAVAMGYDEAILLDTQGFVSEGSGENLFMVRRGKIKTAPLHAILDGITRDTVFVLAEREGWSVEESLITRDELYCADEIFLSGTAAEITPVREVDDRVIGEGRPGPVTRLLKERFQSLVRGQIGELSHWLTTVERPVAAGSEAATASVSS